MPASPATTPYLGLPRFASDASTDLWAHLTAISDAMDALAGPWTEYAPVWSQAGGTILYVGSGSIVGRYRKMGRTVFAQIRLERAADSNIGSDLWIFSTPPVSPRSWNMLGGGFSMVRNGNYFGGSVFPVASGSVGAIVGDAGRISNTTPIATHATGDWYSLQFVYEASA